MLVELVKTQQKKINELLKTSNKMIASLQLQTSAPKKQATTSITDKGMHECKHCKKLTTHQDDNCYHLKKKGCSGKTKSWKNEQKPKPKK